MKKIYSGINRMGRSINRHAPQLLTILGIGSFISATVMAVKATPKYQYEMEELHVKQLNADHKLPKKELYFEECKIIGKNYGPAIGVTVIAAASVLSAQHINSKRIAGLATAYKLSESALREYQEKVIEKFGEKKAKKIRDDIVEDRLKDKPSDEALLDLPREAGDYLCYDCFLDKYFYSTEAKIQKAFNIINRRLTREMYVNLNDLYFELGYAKGSTVGRLLGWTIEHTGEAGVDPDIRAINTDYGPVLTLDYDSDLLINDY